MIMTEDLKIKYWRLKDDIKVLKQMIPYILVSCWMVLIFILSGQDSTESTTVTNGFISNIVYGISSLLNVDMDVETFTDILTTIYLPIRKCAHFFVFFILGILVFNVVKRYTKYTLKQQIMIALLFCVFYACTDEFHQFFVPGRCCSIKDMLIDSSGSLVGITLYVTCIKLSKRAS